MFSFWWQWIKHFTYREKWGNYNKISPLIVFVLDMIRYKTGKAIIIHCGFDTQGHATKSMHYKGLAVDFHFCGCNVTVPLLDMIDVLNILKIPYGLGLYFDWNNKGYHLDIGREKTTYWTHTKDKDYIYFSDKELFLKAIENHKEN
jgi:hypothetical protein